MTVIEATDPKKADIFSKHIKFASPEPTKEAPPAHKADLPPSPEPTKSSEQPKQEIKEVKNTAPTPTTIEPADSAVGTKEEVEVDMDALLLKKFNDKYGADFSSMDEALESLKPAPKEDEETTRRKRANAVLRFGLETGKIAREDYDNYLVDSKRKPEDVVYEDFKNSLKKKNKDLTEEEIVRKFQKKYHLDADPDDEDSEDLIESSRRDLEEKKAQLLKTKYRDVVLLEREYDRHVAEKTTQATRAQTLTTNLNKYKSDVPSIIKEVQALPALPVGDKEDGVNISFAYSDESVREAENYFLKREHAQMFIENYSRESLKESIRLYLLDKNFDKIIDFASRQYNTQLRTDKAVQRKGLSHEQAAGGGTDGTEDPSDLAKNVARLKALRTK